MTPIATSKKGEFRQIVIDPPLALQVGDLVLSDDETLSVIRGGVVVETRSTSAPSSPVDPAVDVAQTVSSLLFFRSYPVAGIIQTLTDVVVNPDNSLLVKFADGSSREFISFAEMQSNVAYVDSSATLAQDMLIRKIGINSPDGANLETMVGGSVAIDFNAATPVVLTEPD
jgi:hypothetical protein